jgi:hypothetical protein
LAPSRNDFATPPLAKLLVRFAAGMIVVALTVLATASAAFVT